MYVLFTNRTEAEALSGVEGDHPALDKTVDDLRIQLPETELVITLGAEGAVFVPRGVQAEPIVVEPVPIERVVDSTAAGDTFIGYFLAALSRGDTTPEALEIAAAALCVTRPDAMSSIPSATEAEALRLSHAGRHR